MPVHQLAQIVTGTLIGTLAGGQGIKIRRERDSMATPRRPEELGGAEMEADVRCVNALVLQRLTGHFAERPQLSPNRWRQIDDRFELLTSS